ncbi:MAG TPA: ferredoxin [Rectinemataceae bacterium]|nr:ferredoxin [Rectinemataceae bacterium]
MIRVDDDRCIGCGLCEDILPQFFEVVDGHVRVRDAESASSDPNVATAIEDCPGDAIFAD